MTKAWRKWLASLHFDRVSEQIVFQKYVHAVHQIEQRVARLENVLREQADTCAHAPTIRALQSLRGMALLTAVTLVAEIGCFSRFRSPAALMADLGLVPREYSSGATTNRGRLTKAGNSNVQRTLVEASWSYRHRPAVRGELAKRLDGQSPDIQEISWKAQNRLHKKYVRLVQRGKHANLAVVSVARELIGFVWAIATGVESAAAAQAA